MIVAPFRSDAQLRVHYLSVRRFVHAQDFCPKCLLVEVHRLGTVIDDQVGNDRRTFQLSCHVSPLLEGMPGLWPGGFGLTIISLCNSFRLDFPRVVTFNRTFIPGFLPSAALA